MRIHYLESCSLVQRESHPPAGRVLHPPAIRRTFRCCGKKLVALTFLSCPFPFLHKCEQGTFGLQGAPFGLGPGPLPSESLMSFFTGGTRPKSYAQIHMP